MVANNIKVLEETEPESIVLVSTMHFQVMS
jgi:hypothetical protein